ncbi:MAG: PIN domain-containing protein [Chloroflexota bacterium]|nr:PIN domain-containing protein [Chloroflexota bacterium]
MPDRIFADTSFLLALSIPRDQYHQQAVALSYQLTGQVLLTTTAVLLELGNALARQDKRQSVRAIENALSSPEIEVVHLTSALFQRAFDLYKARPDKTWGLVDCVSFIAMRDAGVTQALTADRHFVQAGFQILLGTTV